MIQQDSRGGFVNQGNGPAHWNRESHLEDEDTSFGGLVKRLSGDLGNLVSQEIRLAKAELKESAGVAARSGAKLGIALTFALVGAIALSAGIVIVAGTAWGNYWIPALLVGGIELAIGATMARSAMSSLSGDELKPADTLDTLRENKAWASREARDLKHDITSGKSTANAGR